MQFLANPYQDNCHIMNGSTFNQAFDNQSDRDSQMFMDAISLSSDRNSIAYSIYHSVQDLNQFNEADDGTTSQQNSRNDQKVGFVYIFITPLLQTYTFLKINDDTNSPFVAIYF